MAQPQKRPDEDDDDNLEVRMSAAIHNVRFLRSSILTAGVMAVLVYIVKQIVMWILEKL